MEEKKGIQISITNLILVIIILILIITIILIFKSNQKLNSETEKIAQPAISNSILQEEEKISKTNNIPASELTALTYFATNESINLFFGYIEDGKLFYSLDNQTANSTSNSAFEYTSFENVKEYEGLNNIERIKIFNVGNDVNRIPFLITDDGKVYTANIYENELKFTLHESFKNYEVNNIIEISEPHEDGDNFITECKIELKDKTIQTIKI